jgi:hypothetical protein
MKARSLMPSSTGVRSARATRCRRSTVDSCTIPNVALA